MVNNSSEHVAVEMTEIAGQRKTPFFPPTVVRVNVQLNATAYNAAEGTPTVAVCVDALNLQDIAGRTIPVTISATPGSAQG